MTPTPRSISFVSPVPASDLGLVDILRVALHRRRMLLVVPTIAAIAVITWGLTQKRAWTAQASFTATSAGGGFGRLAGFAAQFGVNVPNSDAGRSPDFYADVVRGDGMLRRLLAQPYTTTAGDTIDLVRRLVPGEPDAARRTEFAVRLLRNLVSAGVGLKTGIVRVAVRLDDPEVARQFVEQTLAELNALNIAQHQAQGAQERRFNDVRLESARRELRAAEDRLEAFLRNNRNFAASPQLGLQEDRLRREVAFKQQVVGGLQQGFEQARLEEARDVPMITVIEAPTRPALPDSRRLLLKALFAWFATAVALLGLAIGGEWRGQVSRSRPELAAEIGQLGREAWHDLRRPWRLMGLGSRSAA